MGPRLGYRPALDGLRALAVLGVVAFHGAPQLVPGGYVGVDVFFVLSGFLITTLLLEELDSRATVSLRRFYARRALRLVPALVAMVAVVMVVEAVRPPVGIPVNAARDGLSALAYVSNWMLAWHRSAGGLLGHTWSLAQEEQFYLVWPVVLLGLLRVGGRRFAAVACLSGAGTVWFLRAIAFSHGVSKVRLYHGPDARADALLIGCALALARSLGYTPRVPRAVLVASIATLGAVALWVPRSSGLLYSGGFTVIAFAAAAIIVRIVVVPHPRLVSVLSRDPLVRLGRISYGIYLWHAPIYLVVHPLIGGPAWLGPLWLTPLAVGAAQMSFRFIERPALAAKARFTTTTAAREEAVVEMPPMARTA
jgi:peptidoglycan/LPS O-acetylase OafA/YrhL